VRRDQLLVRGDDVLAGGQRLEDQVARRVDPPDRLDHDVDAGIPHDLPGVGGDDATGELDRPRLGGVSHGYPHELDRTAHATLELGRMAPQDRSGSAADDPTPEQPDVDVALEGGRAHEVKLSPFVPGSPS
jgi:hypothetical protein